MNTQQILDQFPARVAPLHVSVAAPRCVDGVVVIAQGTVDVTLSSRNARQFAVHNAVLRLLLPQGREIYRRLVRTLQSQKRLSQTQLLVVVIMGVAQGR